MAAPIHNLSAKGCWGHRHALAALPPGKRPSSRCNVALKHDLFKSFCVGDFQGKFSGSSGFQPYWTVYSSICVTALMDFPVYLANRFTDSVGMMSRHYRRLSVSGTDA
jgi:hypothetical protein